MHTIREISEDEMIAIYLQTELFSARFRKPLEMHRQQEQIDPCIIQEPDWHKASENVLRQTLLGAYRGYGRNERYFTDFPASVHWERAWLPKEELEQISYIDWEYWVELT